MAKEQKTNAMRILDRAKIPYSVQVYVCDAFVDGVHIADLLGQPHEITFKTLVACGKSGGHYVFVLPVAEELNLKKCAASVGEKSVELVPVKEIFGLTGYIRGGCTPIGMKKAFPVVIHESAKKLDTMIISGGRLGTQIHLCPSDLIKVTEGRYADLIDGALQSTDTKKSGNEEGADEI